MDFDGDVLAVSTDGFAGDDLGADGGLEGDFEVLAGDDGFEFFGDFATEGVGFAAVAHQAKGVNAIAGDEEVEANEVLGAVVGEFVVEAGIAGGDGFELVVEVGQEVGHGSFEVDHGAILDVTEVGLVAAFCVDEAENGADHGSRKDDFAFDPRFADFADGGLVGEVGGGAKVELFAAVQSNLVVGGRIGDDKVKTEFALEAFADDVHVEQTEEADAETEAEHGRVFGFKMEGGVGEGELLDGVFEVLVLVVADGEKAGVNEGEDVFVAWERGGVGSGDESDGVANLGFAGGFEVGDDVANLAGGEFGARGHFGGEGADFEGETVRGGGKHADGAGLRDGTIKHADVEDDAAVIVKVGVKDEGAGGRGGGLEVVGGGGGGGFPHRDRHGVHSPVRQGASSRRDRGVHPLVRPGSDGGPVRDPQGAGGPHLF